MIINKIPALLKFHSITRYRLAKESKLSTQTIYAMVANDNPRYLHLDALEATLKAMKTLTGEKFEFSDFYEIVEEI